MKPIFTLLFLLCFQSLSFAQLNISYEEDELILKIKSLVKTYQFDAAAVLAKEEQAKLPFSFWSNIEYAFEFNLILDTVEYKNYTDKQWHLGGLDKKEYEIDNGKRRLIYSPAFETITATCWHGLSFTELDSAKVVKLKQNMKERNWFDGPIDSSWNNNLRRLLIYYGAIEYNVKFIIDLSKKDAFRTRTLQTMGLVDLSLHQLKEAKEVEEFLSKEDYFDMNFIDSIKVYQGPFSIYSSWVMIKNRKKIASINIPPGYIE